MSAEVPWLDFYLLHVKINLCITWDGEIMFTVTSY